MNDNITDTVAEKSMDLDLTIPANLKRLEAEGKGKITVDGKEFVQVAEDVPVQALN